MKKRLSSGFSSAAGRLIEALGIKRVASTASRSSSLIYKWADQDLGHFPTLKQALELDALFVREGHGAPPFISAYMAILRHTIGGHMQPHEGVLPDALKLVNLACAVLQEIAAQKVTSESDKAPPAKTKCNICFNLRKLAEVEAGLAWRMADDMSQNICPLRRLPSASVDCSLSGPRSPSETSA